MSKELAASAHKIVPEINAHYREFKKARAEGLKNAIRIGELLLQMKEALPHGEFTDAIEKRCEFTPEWGRICMRVASGQELLSKLEEKPESVTEAAKLIAEHSPRPKQKSLPVSPPSGNDSISANGRPGGVPSTSIDNSPVSTAPESGETADSSKETDPRPPRSGKDKPGVTDYGKCPNCAGTKWDEDEFGVTCSKCHHPHGEPADRQPEEKEQPDILRAKTVKTVEAAMRCFDDLNLLLPRAGTHKQCLALCETLWKSAKGWK